eukprot:scaffold5238_cov140-Skeletonema_dohrnii-CCMP3373.AAC.1
MANYNGSPEAVDCHIHSVGYDMAVNRGAGGRLRCQMPYQVTYDVVETKIRPINRVELAVVLDASSGHVRCCSDADTSNQCLSRVKDAFILSWPTLMGHQKLLIVIFTA